MWASGLLLLALLPLAAQQPRVETRDGKRVITNARKIDAADTRILIVGNSLSYFNEMPWMLEQIARSKGKSLYAEFSGRSGRTMKQHWDHGLARKRIEIERWDFVVLQAQSSEAITAPETFAEYARKFDALIRKHGAKTVIVETWAPRMYRLRQREYTERYSSLTKELGATLAPVGTAWQRLEERGIKLFEDRTHPNVAGSYLFASVLYAIVFGQSPAGAVHTFDVNFSEREFFRRSLEEDTIDGVTAAQIQQEAWRSLGARTRRGPPTPP